MNGEQLAMLAIGQIIAAGMFAGGILVGVSLARKDATNDNSDKDEAARWHRLHDSLR